MSEIDYLHQNFTLPNFLDNLIHRLKHYDPDAFSPNGLICFCGVQGSGKTLSAVLYLHQLLLSFPLSICVSNIALNFSDIDSSRIIPYSGVDQMTTIENGKYGVIYFLDEIQIEFNSLESKQMNIPIFELVCQQRKQRKHIIGTTQVFARLAKPFREQFKYCVLCENYFSFLFCQRVYTAENIATEDDVRTELSPKCTRFYIPSQQDFALYDTYVVVKRTRDRGF